MARARKRVPRASGDQELEDCDGPNQATRRRLRNRLTQRNFRERKSMYIKELEERSKLNTESESDRNKALAREAAKLRKEMLKLRSKVLKLSVCLNAIGSEVGKILEVEGTEESEEEQADRWGSLMDTSAEPASVPGEALGGPMRGGLEGEVCIGHGNRAAGSPKQTLTAGGILCDSFAGQPAEESSLPQGEDMHHTSGSPDITRIHSAETTFGVIGDVNAMQLLDTHLDHLAVLATQPEGLAGSGRRDGEPGSEPPQLFTNNSQQEHPVDLDLQIGTHFDVLTSVTFPDPESWMMSIFEDSGSCPLEDESPASESLTVTRQNMANTSRQDQGNFVSITMIPLQPGR
ncbi:hypothetical protein EDB80DRAFT_421981 [Ilyonectria destructans]|nr:hypothetical protein EDB80DRAFT_421981 [Ilyonectria destructans]